MTRLGFTKSWLTVLCLASIALYTCASPAFGAAGDPLFVLIPSPKPQEREPKPPPTGRLNGPCGMGVDSGGNFYVSDYYHHEIDIFSGAFHLYLGQIASDTLDPACQLAFDSADALFTNEYHREVGGISSEHPTGIAIDTSDDHLYVNHRTYVSAYLPGGAPVEVGGEALRIGLGTLGDGYSLAVSQFPGTAGRIYVPDAASNTVKVYDPSVDKVNPVQAITGPGLGFVSLRDAAIAVDRASGNIYVADNLQPAYTEKPEAAIEVFDPSGSYPGRLKFKVVDALPPGLAVDNSGGPSQGRVYVTSGNTDEAAIYAYPPGAQIASALPAQQKLEVSTSGGGSGSVASGDGAGVDCSGSCEADIRSGARVTLSATADRDSVFAGWSGACRGVGPCTVTMDEARSLNARFDPVPVGPSAPGPGQPWARDGVDATTVTQKGTLRLSASGHLSPQRLPREKAAPIDVSVGWRIATTDLSPAPKLKTLEIEINRHGRFDSAGLPLCPYPKIQPATSSRALANCRPALVGRGSFTAEIGLQGQERYATRGRLLVFNGESHGKPVLFGQIYSPRPFATSFVIIFKVKKIRSSTYGTALSATLPKALASWGNLTGIEMRLGRRYSYEGKPHSYASAACPAPHGFSQAVFPLARASFLFEGQVELSSTFTSSCRTRG
jgi:DNA-binding beta-propeller fold protein YncE